MCNPGTVTMHAECPFTTDAHIKYCTVRYQFKYFDNVGETYKVSFNYYQADSGIINDEIGNCNFRDKFPVFINNF
jgi:hypothetical protein